jgi:hypothetical protein
MHSAMAETETANHVNFRMLRQDSMEKYIDVAATHNHQA